MLYRRLVASALCLAVATPVFAEDVPTPATAAPAKPVKERKVCRQDTATGSIMPHTTCHTKDEWAQIDAANQSNAQQFGDNLRRGTAGSR
jgi:hypothetical protein